MTFNGIEKSQKQKTYCKYLYIYILFYYFSFTFIPILLFRRWEKQMIPFVNKKIKQISGQKKKN